MTVEKFAVESRQPNWLPLPCEIAGKAPIEEAPVEDDLFTKGEVVAYYPRQGFGVVKGKNGEELPFRLTEVSIVDAHGHMKDLCEGRHVGYDVSWTAGGPHISRLKIY